MFGGVHALAAYGSTVYAAGFFTSIGGQTRNLIAGLKASDGTATSFDPNAAPGFGGVRPGSRVGCHALRGGILRYFRPGLPAGVRRVLKPVSAAIGRRLPEN